MKYVRKRRGRGAIYCGLDIGCGWCVEMYDIKNYFDKHCLSQKRLRQGNIKTILYKFASGIFF